MVNPADGGEPTVESYLKPRITTDPSHGGDDAVNAGVETHERLPKEALLNYYNIRIIELCESKGMDVCDTPMIFLLCYDLVSMSMLEDAPATTTVVLNSEEIGFD